MSANVVSKMDVDVLVQLASIGPLEAEAWVPMTHEPDLFGRALWERNYENAADPELDDALPEYTFAPLPVVVTAAEGVNQVLYYRSQTANEDDWRRGGLGELLEALTDRLIPMIPDVREAPWGWDAKELAARSGRAVPLLPEAEKETPEPLVTQFLEAWQVTGLPLHADVAAGSITRIAGLMSELGLPDPRDCLGAWWVDKRWHVFSLVQIYLLTTVSAAETVFTGLATKNQGNSSLHQVRSIYLFGSAVISSMFPNEEPATWPVEMREAFTRARQQAADVREALSRLGEPDQRWSTIDPLMDVQATVPTTGVPLSNVVNKNGRARGATARTPKALTRSKP